MTDEEKLVTGAWIDAAGTIIAAIASNRAFEESPSISNKLTAVGDGLQAVGTAFMASVTTDNHLSFTGNWIDTIGAAATSLAEYMQGLDETVDADFIRLEVLGESFQSIGASMSSFASYLLGEKELAIGNALQGLGAGLEAIGSVHELKGNQAGQIIGAIGAILQAIGSNYYAVVVTKE
ncbi:hypothetical protein SAMN05216389_101241 [Oceanobacillus limi]|uniref:Uncharacterized protein n=1 Tax=Oceanobacillus limi TaxID=930131 RepID=A0A1H9Y7S1_9BACI|nr:hypothetical protein [Oceanobacillus limi]SES64824.1 hypothetical protein SAMN05216389_101241 [Oceanobacillus limi]